MIERRRGRIINLSSGVGYIQHPYASAYGCSKAALTYLTNVLAAEVKDYGISVFAYNPGLVRTTMSEYAADSSDVHESIKGLFQKRFTEGSDTPMERTVQMLMFVASGKADALSGRSISVSDDEADLLSRIDEIQQGDLYTLRLRV